MKMNQPVLDAAAGVVFVIGVAGAIAFFRRAKRIWDEAA